MGIGAGWYYDSVDGDVIHQNLAESIPNAAFKYFHGPYKTEQLAIAHKGVAGPPGVPNESLGSQAASVATGGPGGMNWQNWILRIGEILLGVTLIGVGVAKLTGAENVISKAAVTAGKASLL
jgi:hypothetical protein